MNENEVVIISGLAAAVGRLMVTLQQTEVALAEATAKLEEQDRKDDNG
jgi:hypothetical protein